MEKTLMLEKMEGRRKRGWQRMRWLDGITDLMDMSLGPPGSQASSRGEAKDSALLSSRDAPGGHPGPATWALGTGRIVAQIQGGRLWQFAHPRPLSLLQRGLAPRSKGKARAELREGLLFLHGLESNPGSSLQTEEEAGLP